MGELIVGGCIVLMFYVGRDMDYCVGKNFNSCFIFFLILVMVGYVDKYLFVILSCMVDVLVVMVVWFKGDIGNVCLFMRDRGEVIVISEILCISGVWFFDRKNYFVLECCFFIFIFIRDIFILYFFGKMECCLCFWLFCIEVDVSDDFCNFCMCNIVVFG